MTVKWKPGDKVVRRNTPWKPGGPHGPPEFGVVVHCWFSEEIQGYDTYVAFFGDAFPDGTPEEGTPYILRYGAGSLEAYEKAVCLVTNPSNTFCGKHTDKPLKGKWENGELPCSGCLAVCKAIGTLSNRLPVDLEEPEDT